LRADLEKLDEVAAAFVNAGAITLMMVTADSYDEEKIGEMTEKRKSKIKTSTKLASSPL
jgi:glutaminase